MWDWRLVEAIFRFQLKVKSWLQFQLEPRIRGSGEVGLSFNDELARATYGCEARAGSRSTEHIRGEEFFDRGELPDALGRHARALTEDLLLVRVAALGVSFALLAFKSRKLGTNFFARKHQPHFGDKSGKLAGESRMVTGGAGEIHRFLADCLVERRLKPKALSDGPRRFASLDPNLMVFASTHL